MKNNNSTNKLPNCEFSIAAYASIHMNFLKKVRDMNKKIPVTLLLEKWYLSHCKSHIYVIFSSCRKKHTEKIQLEYVRERKILHRFI